MSEQCCGTCKWIRDTGDYTSKVCAAPVPLWVAAPDDLLARRVLSIGMHDCPTYEAKP